MNHPEVVDRLAILDAAHPRKLQRGCSNPSQLRRRWYFFFFALPWLPERIVRADDWRFFRDFLRDARPAYTPRGDRPLRRGVVAARSGDGDDQLLPLLGARPRAGEIRPISAPTLVIWGQRDRYLGRTLAEPDHDDVPNLDRVERLPDASHWVHHDEAERVNQLLVDFFAPARATSTK